MKTIKIEMLTVSNWIKVSEKINKGLIFGAKFVKKDNSIRVMSCKIGVKKHLKGGALKFNPSERALIPVFDMVKKDYRFVNMNTVISIKFDKVVYITPEHFETEKGFYI